MFCLSVRGLTSLAIASFKPNPTNADLADGLSDEVLKRLAGCDNGNVRRASCGAVFVVNALARSRRSSAITTSRRCATMLAPP